MNALKAENESLKAQLQDAKELIADLRSELHAEGCDVNDLRTEVESLRAERDKMLEVVIREYRNGGKHQGCTDLSTWPFSGVDNRCPTCIKADALLPKEER